MNYMERLERPKGKVDVVLDTDTYNEIDDQFALSYLVKSDEKLTVQAIYAAPFFNDRSSSPLDGMERSYNEIKKLLSLLNRDDLQERVFLGSPNYLIDEKTPVLSDSAKDLVERSKAYTMEHPLYVVAIGAITNVASAILIDPEIINRIVVVWLGGNAHDWIDNYEFNAMQDVAAMRVVFGCGVPVVQLPCMGVVSSFSTTQPELEYWLKGKSELCDYLVDSTVQEAKRVQKEKTWSRAIWDVTAVAWLISDDFMSDVCKPSPIAQYDHHYSFDNRRHMIKYVYFINRDKLFEDLFEKLTR